MGGHIFLYLPFHNLFRVERDKTDTEPLSQSSPLLAPLLSRISPTGPSKSFLPVSSASLAGSLIITYGTFSPKSALSLLLKTTHTPQGHLEPSPGHHLTQPPLLEWLACLPTTWVKKKATVKVRTSCLVLWHHRHQCKALASIWWDTDWPGSSEGTALPPTQSPLGHLPPKCT